MFKLFFTCSTNTTILPHNTNATNSLNTIKLKLRLYKIVLVVSDRTATETETETEVSTGRGPDKQLKPISVQQK